MAALRIPHCGGTGLTHSALEEICHDLPPALLALAATLSITPVLSLDIPSAPSTGDTVVYEVFSPKHET